MDNISNYFNIYLNCKRNKLGLEFARYKDRWDKLSRSIETVNKDIQNVSVTTDKITKKFETINKVDVNKLLEKK